ncbi:MAG: GerMN domain-containing protein [Spirochaetales bacterium]|nr:GerMN domain-containing protein [Spirochaetales bacterium]
MLNKIKGFSLTTKNIAIILGAVFSFSLLLFLVFGPDKKRVMLFFPQDDYNAVSGDLHIIPRKHSREESMKALLAEALLEPYDYHLNETVPEGVVINSLIYDKEKEVLYVDLSLELLDLSESHSSEIDGDRMLAILEKNLRFNFSYLEQVLFTIDGEVPHSYVFRDTQI